MGDEKERFTRINCKSSDEPLSRPKTKVRVGSELSEEFLVQVGVGQCFQIFFPTWPIMSLGESYMAHQRYLIRIGYVIVAGIY